MSGKNGRIAGIFVYSGKGLPGQAVKEAVLEENKGMKGDFHAQDGARQLSLFTVEGRAWLRQAVENNISGLCFKRFKENITLEGIDSASLSPGVYLRAGVCLLEISLEGKHCHDGCALFNADAQCLLAGQNIFAVVKEGGVARVGDAVSIEERLCDTGRE